MYSVAKNHIRFPELIIVWKMAASIVVVITIYIVGGYSKTTAQFVRYVEISFTFSEYNPDITNNNEESKLEA